MEELLDYIEVKTTNPDMNKGIMLCFVIFALSIVRICADVSYWTVSLRTAIRLRSGTLSLVFKRVAKLRSLQDRSVGEVSFTIITATCRILVQPTIIRFIIEQT